MRKFLSLVLALVMVCSFTVIASSAADTPAGTATVTLYDINGNPVTSGEYNVGDTITCTVYLDTSALGTIGSIKGAQTYTSSVLSLADAYESNLGMITDLAGMFPVTKKQTVANGKLDGKVAYNASTPNMGEDGFKFVENSILMQTHYTVNAAGTAEIHNELTTLAVADYNLTRIIVKGVVLDNNFAMDYTLSESTAVQGATVSGNITAWLAKDTQATVKLTGTDNNFTATVNGTTDYSIANVPDGTYTLTVSAQYHSTREYEVTVSGDTTKDVKIHRIGDVNGDGKITTVDFGKANSHARKKSLLTGYELVCADTIGGDGVVATSDAGRINSHAKSKSMLWPAIEA